MKYDTGPIEGETILYAELAEGYRALVVVDPFGHAGVALCSPREGCWDRKKGLKIARGRCRKATFAARFVVLPDLLHGNPSSLLIAHLYRLGMDLDQIGCRLAEGGKKVREVLEEMQAEGGTILVLWSPKLLKGGHSGKVTKPVWTKSMAVAIPQFDLEYGDQASAQESAF